MPSRFRAYLHYLREHRRYVAEAGRVLNVSRWQLLIHDWSKFLPVEWSAYAGYFYNADGSKRPFGSQSDEEKAEFERAWLHHQHLNPHHHQHWVLREDSGVTRALPMPDKYIREMVADWAGAGRAITGKWEFMGWYTANVHKMVLHPDTKKAIETYLEELYAAFKGSSNYKSA